MRTYITRGALLLALASLASCATLGAIVQAPQFRTDNARAASVQFMGPSLQHPIGGVTIRMWAHVHNPNPVGITLATLAGDLALEGTQAARVQLPLGMPLPAARDTVFPIDVTVSFTNVPRLADAVSRAVTQGSLNYRLDGRIGVDAGVLGQPTFGPMTFVQGAVQTR